MKPTVLTLLAFVCTAAMALATPSPIQPVAIRADSTDLQAYVGTYTFESGSPINQFVIKVEKGELFGEADVYGANKLLKQEKPDTFKSTSQYGSVLTFTRDPATKAITGFRMAIMDQELVAKKK